MLLESASIFALLLCVIIIFVRSGYKKAALGVAPLLLVPAVHMLAYPVTLWISRFTLFSRNIMIAFADIGAVLISGIMIHQFGAKMNSSKGKKLYMVLVSGYNIILACILVYRILMMN